MEIGPISRTNISAPADVVLPGQDSQVPVRQIITAIRGLNKSEMLGQERQLAFSRDPETHRPVIQIVDRNTGDVLDQIPPETVLRIMQEMKRQDGEKE
jgi:flagellar protein FlaG